MDLLSPFRNGGVAREFIRDNVSENIRQDARNLKSGNWNQKAAAAVGLGATAYNAIPMVPDAPEYDVSEMAGQTDVYNQDGSLISANRRDDAPTGSTAGDQGTGSGSGSSSGSGTGSGSTTPDPYAGYNANDERAYNQDQIDNINKLLGFIDSQAETGKSNLDNQYNYQKSLSEKNFNDQSVQNMKDREQGAGQVDNYANTSYNSLMRLLGGAGAGNSSVARTVVPTLVSRGASARRSGVFDTYGQNQKSLVDTNDQNVQSLNNWKGQEDAKFMSGINNRKSELIGQRQNYEITGNQLSNTDYIKNLVDTGGTHNGYSAARTAGASSQGEIDKLADLNRMFGAFKPTYTAGLKTADLNKFTVDKANIDQQGQTPTETSPYLAMMKRKQELNY